MSVTDDLVAANSEFARVFRDGDLPAPPARAVAVLTCMDARLDPLRFLGLSTGDAHVIRNAGGRASDDAIRSLIISSTLLGTKEFLVIHHTECGMLAATNEDLRQRLSEATRQDASKLDFLPFADLEQSVREDVAAIRASAFIDSAIPIAGHVYDVRTGALREVVRA